MRNFNSIRATVVAFAFIALTLSSGASPRISKGVRPSINTTAEQNLPPAGAHGPDLNGGVDGEGVSATPDSLSSTSTYYSLRPDMRLCISPMCGGYFVKQVNMARTRCANGRFMAECYLAGIDWHGQPTVDASRALVRGNIVARRYGRFGNLGEFRVTESWQAASDNEPSGPFYSVRDRGLRCITSPCPTHHEAKLNSTFSRNIAGVDLAGAGAAEDVVSEAFAQMTGVDGVIVTGSHVPVTGPGGRSLELKATQFYLRAGKQAGNRPPPAKPPAMKRCFKTGCGNQVCADHNVITTCEWRPEYACYQKAKCERQTDGNCGFTRTPELTACLKGK